MKTGVAILILITVLVVINCKMNNSNDSEHESDFQEDTIAVASEFESEAQVYESAERVIWQKPDLVIDQLGNVEGKIVADLGAGTGYFSRRLAYKGATVIAIDIDPRAVQWMELQRSRFPAELQERLIIRQAEPDDPRLEPGEVDMVLLVNTYTFIAERIKYFSNLREAIRPGGIVLIIDFKKTETPFGPPVEERVDIAQVEAELRAAGYSILKADEESLEYQYIVKARRN